MKYTFGDIVVVNEDEIGVIVKCWCKGSREEPFYEVYVRNYNEIYEFKESQIQRYMVRHKYLSEEEKEYQYNAINGL